MTTAVYARGLSAMKEARVRASKNASCLGASDNSAFSKPVSDFVGNKAAFVEAVRQALYASKICSYAQGFVQLQSRQQRTQLEFELR